MGIESPFEEAKRAEDRHKSNGVIRIGHKGVKKFAFGESGQPFEVDVVQAFQEWIGIDQSFRDEEGKLPITAMPSYNSAAKMFATNFNRGVEVTTGEALDFIARLREQWDELTDFFQPRSREKPSSPGASEVRFSHAAT